MLLMKGLAYLVTAMIFVQLGECQDLEDLQFTQASYEATLVAGLSTVKGSFVTAVGFNRALTSDEKNSIQFFPPSSKLSVNATTLVITVAENISETFAVFIGVSSGILKTVRIDVYVIDPDKACVNQSAGRCSQVCTLSNSSRHGYLCSCQDGYSLQRDGRTCAANNPTPVILLSHNNRITEIDSFRKESSALYQQPDNNNISFFDYSYEKQLLYFFDVDLQQIVQTSLSGSGPATPIVTSGLQTLSGLAVDWVSGNVLFSDSALGKIQQYHIGAKLVTPLFTGLQSPKDVVVVPDQPYRFLFWFEELTAGQDQFVIKRAPLDAGSSGVIQFDFNIPNPTSMAADVTNGVLYWTEDGTVIKSSLFDGSNVQDVYTSNSPVDSMVVFEDYVYLASDSSNVITRINKRDSAQERLEYILDDDINKIQELRILHPLAQPISGEDVNECLINNGGCGQGCVNTIGSYYCACIAGYSLLEDGLTCVNNSLCSVQNLGCSSGCGVNASDSSQNVCTCNPGYQLGSDGKTCTDINECLQEDTCSHGCLNTDGGFKCSCPAELFVGADQRTCTGCSIDNGGCSQTCVTFTNSFQCQCETGFVLETDGRSCSVERASTLISSLQLNINSVTQNIVVETTSNGVFLNNLVYTTNTEAQSTGTIIGMDVDTTGDYLYFGDRDNTGLFRVQLSNLRGTGDQRTRIIDGVKIWGVAYDWVNKFVYWTEDESGKIKRVSVSGSDFTEELVLGNLKSPQGITVEPFTRYIYWTEAGNGAQIYRASISSPSSSIQVLVNSSFPANFTALTIDYLSSKLIWADYSNETIWYSDLDGSDAQTLFIAKSSNQTPFDIVITGDRLYWTSAVSSLGNVVFNMITLYDSDSSLVQFPLLGYAFSTSAIGITVIDENKILGNGYHECLVNSPSCSHYCSIDTDGKPVCTCPDGYVLLQDQKTCANVFHCPGARACNGSFANTTNLPLFTLPSMEGGQLNSQTTPMMVSGQVLENCELVAAEFLDQSCQYENIDENLFDISGSSLYATNVNILTWSDLNGRVVTITLSCAAPITDDFCISFEVSTHDSAVGSCGLSNGGCSDFCTTEFSNNLRICTCPAGEVLGQNGVDCIDPCDPSPCQNGGICFTDSLGSVQCTCPQSHTGPFCSLAAQPTCPEDFCNSAEDSITIKRLVGGDHMVYPQPVIPESFCFAMNGCCVGSEQDICDACQCRPNDSFMLQTKKCSNEDCLYRFANVSQRTPPLYLNSDGKLASVETNAELPIVNTVTGSPISSPGCSVSTTQVNTGNGWVSLSLNGTVELIKAAGNVYLSVGSGVDTDQLVGQLIKVILSCEGGEEACLTFSFYGSGVDLSLSEVCNDCKGYLEGFENLGTSVVTRLSPGTTEGPLSAHRIVYNGSVVASCNELSVTYYDDDCGLVSVPNNLIYVTEDLVRGRNGGSSSWETITGRMINITLNCNVNGGENTAFCLLVHLQNTSSVADSDVCSDSSPCENEGTCLSIGISDFYCECPTGFTGKNCSEVDHCLDHVCLNNATCINCAGYAMCNCPTNNLPPYCIGPDDNNFGPCDLLPCNNGGSCVPSELYGYICECAVGFVGIHCDLEDPCVSNPNPCPSNTICISSGSQFYCEGGLGEEVDQGSGVDPCNSINCQNNGVCVSGICNCASGYTGDNCETDINECEPNPCQNGGSCQQGLPGEYSCTCVPGYTGINCETDIDECASDPCLNGATCDQRGIGEFLCTCANGFFGTDCSQSCNCENGASCDSRTGVCICEGYTGARCETPICTSGCQNGGTCVAPDVCACLDTFVPPDCVERECTDTHCNGRGDCSLNLFDEPSCTCNGGFTGPRCEITVSGQFSNEEKGGVSAGVIIGFIIGLVLIVAAVFFVWKVAIPYWRRKNAKETTWYTDPAMVRANPSTFADELLDSEYIAREFKDRGLSAPLDNPLYGYIPPKVNNTSRPSSIQLSHSSSILTTDDDEWVGVSAVMHSSRPEKEPSTIIMNKHVSTSAESIDSISSTEDATVTSPLNGHPSSSTVDGVWRSSSNTRPTDGGDLV